jgi:hypothetical protein
MCARSNQASINLEPSAPGTQQQRENPARPIIKRTRPATYSHHTRQPRSHHVLSSAPLSPSLPEAGIPRVAHCSQPTHSNPVAPDPPPDARSGPALDKFKRQCFSQRLSSYGLQRTPRESRLRIGRRPMTDTKRVSAPSRSQHPFRWVPERASFARTRARATSSHAADPIWPLTKLSAHKNCLTRSFSATRARRAFSIA